MPSSPWKIFLTVACRPRNECRRFGRDHCGPAPCLRLHRVYCAQRDYSCRQGPFCTYLRHHSLSIDSFVFDSLTPVNLLPVFYVLQTVAYSLFAPIKYSIFQNAADSSMRCSLISVQSQMVAVGAVLFYLLNAVLSSVAGIRVVLLVALGISSLVYIPALFRLTSQRP